MSLLCLLGFSSPKLKIKGFYSFSVDITSAVHNPASPNCIQLRNWLPSLPSPTPPVSPPWKQTLEQFLECPFRNSLFTYKHIFHTHGVYYTCDLYIFVLQWILENFLHQCVYIYIILYNSCIFINVQMEHHFTYLVFLQKIITFEQY